MLQGGASASALQPKRPNGQSLFTAEALASISLHP